MILSIPLLISLATAPSTPSVGPEVELRSFAYTPGERIQLRDVVEPADAALLPESVLSIDLGRSPSVGFRRKLDVRAIEAAVGDERVRFSGPGEVLVETDVVSIDPERLVDAAREELLAAVVIDGDTEIEVSRAPREVRAPRGRDRVELVARLSGSVRSRGSVGLHVEVVVDGRSVASTPVSFLLRTYDWVPVLVSDLRSGEPLTSSHYEIRRVETTRMNSLPSADAEPLLGLIARRPLRAGEPLGPSDFDQPVYVEPRQPVTLTYRTGNLTVQAFGLSKELGRLGDLIRVENLRTRKIVYGRVVAPGRVDMTP